MRASTCFDEDLRYGNTIKGNALAMASAATLLKRSSAEKILQEFLQRVVQLNRDPSYAYKVTRVVVFGSYLSDKERIADIDLALEMEPREPDEHEQERLCRDRIERACAAGRRFSNISEEVCWPTTEVRRFLKSRSRALSIHNMCELKVLKVPTKTIYPDDSQQMTLFGD